jgi:hypothetical protein
LSFLELARRAIFLAATGHFRPWRSAVHFSTSAQKAHASPVLFVSPLLDAQAQCGRHVSTRPQRQKSCGRYRPYQESKAKAEADKPSIREQHDDAGSVQFLFDRNAADDYESAQKMVGNVPLIEVAKFWRLHHPDKPKRKLAELFEAFLARRENPSR